MGPPPGEEGEGIRSVPGQRELRSPSPPPPTPSISSSELKRRPPTALPRTRGPPASSPAAAEGRAGPAPSPRGRDRGPLPHELLPLRDSRPPGSDSRRPSEERALIPSSPPPRTPSEKRAGAGGGRRRRPPLETSSAADARAGAQARRRGARVPPAPSYSASRYSSGKKEAEGPLRCGSAPSVVDPPLVLAP
ncbi:unnamed protein product [Urochloa humidicola]